MIIGKGNIEDNVTLIGWKAGGLHVYYKKTEQVPSKICSMILKKVTYFRVLAVYRK